MNNLTFTTTHGDYPTTNKGKGCSLCELNGRQNASSHTLENCYANPKSSKCRPVITKLRLAEIKRKGLPIPECMKEIADLPEWQMGPQKEGSNKAHEVIAQPKIDKVLMAQLDHDFQ